MQTVPYLCDVFHSQEPQRKVGQGTQTALPTGIRKDPHAGRVYQKDWAQLSMSNNRHPKKSKLLPFERKMAIGLVVGYDQIQKELDDMIQQSVVMDGQPKGNMTGDPTGAAVLRRERKRTKLEAVDKALLTIPPEYRDIVFRWVKADHKRTLVECGGEWAHRNTYSHWKEEFLYWVAVNYGIHEEWR